MNTRHLLLPALFAGSLAVAMPASAALPPGAFVIAKRGADDAPSAERADDRRRDGRRSAGRSDDERGYGYGYERRQRAGSESTADDHRRDREHRNERSLRDDDRGQRGGRR